MLGVKPRTYPVVQQIPMHDARNKQKVQILITPCNPHSTEAIGSLLDPEYYTGCTLHTIARPGLAHYLSVSIPIL